MYVHSASWYGSGDLVDGLGAELLVCLLELLILDLRERSAVVTALHLARRVLLALVVGAMEWQGESSA